MTKHRAASASASIRRCITLKTVPVSLTVLQTATRILSISKFSGVLHLTTEVEEEDYIAEAYLVLA